MKKKCMIAMDAMNQDLTFKVARNWETMEGTLEAWKCPTCKQIRLTEMKDGVREDVTGLLVIQDEKPIS
jgi:hypothetical protein